MESEQETSSIFSKLNVNAVEFVPSFSTTASALKDPEVDDESDTQKSNVEQSKNNGTCKSAIISPNFSRDEKVHSENFCHIECLRSLSLCES